MCAVASAGGATGGGTEGYGQFNALGVNCNTLRQLQQSISG